MESGRPHAVPYVILQDIGMWDDWNRANRPEPAATFGSSWLRRVSWATDKLIEDRGKHSIKVPDLVPWIQSLKVKIKSLDDADVAGVDFINYSRDALMRKLARTDEPDSAADKAKITRPTAEAKPMLVNVSQAGRCVVLSNMFDPAE
ncbi:Phosphatidylinositol-3-phosphatase SAC1 [Coniosporium apollinis]|uniref:Phosphatidylinositol-3-phosphatase SAC1 n=1 Tax=Coniosporium apollinis TaxID=61459 RepID=A0ABQ9NQT6_9PEZI|nr:Phosphatidylinositol-3-phosphatase SAC1 [Coniosporium apollinis]